MPPSLVRYANRTSTPDGTKLHWDRANVDGLPFRGDQSPMYREDEWDEKTVKVADARNGFFDVSDPASNKQYLDVLECCYNGWFQLVHLERFWADPETGRRTRFHYVEWVEYYIEDGTRTPYVNQGIMELSHGKQNLLGYTGAG